jgi:hypothetical protein
MTATDRVRKHRAKLLRNSPADSRSGSARGSFREYANLPRPEDVRHGKKSRTFSSNISVQTLPRPVVSRPLRRIRRTNSRLTGNSERKRVFLERTDEAHSLTQALLL